ncbi:MAG: hypothetical protein BWY76_03126 [bacterium ADurb.Bin429]|nr:MAG: hypothetical protein BWY76_03126 [bacterium ADurb.Bin429]
MPVRGDAHLGGAVHLPGAYLHFQRLPAGTDDLQVQRLVVIRLRTSDVVGEHTRHRHPQVIDHTQRGVAGGHGIYQHADGFQVENLAKVHPLRAHFIIDGIKMFRAPHYLRLDAEFRQRIAQLLNGAAHHILALTARAVHLLLNFTVGFGINHPQRQVFQLPLNLPYPQPVGDGREDTQRLVGDALLVRLAEMSDRADVVQPVSQLYEDDADIFRGGDEHAAKVFRLTRFAGV